MAKMVDGYYDGDQESLYCHRVRECAKCKETKNILIYFPPQRLICKECNRKAALLKRNGALVKKDRVNSDRW